MRCIHDDSVGYYRSLAVLKPRSGAPWPQSRPRPDAQAVERRRHASLERRLGRGTEVDRYLENPPRVLEAERVAWSVAGPGHAPARRKPEPGGSVWDTGERAA